MRYAPLALGVLFLAGCATGQPVTAAQHVPRPHTCDWYKPSPRGEGATALSFTVKTDGRLEDIAVTKSSGSVEIDKASMGCAAYWHYHPAMADDKPQAQRWGATIDWRADKVVIYEGIR